MGGRAAGSLPRDGEGSRRGCEGQSPYSRSVPPGTVRLMSRLQMFPRLEGAVKMLEDGLRS